MKLFEIIFKNHVKSIFIFFISVNILILTLSVIVYDQQLRYMEYNVVYNIDEYDEIDREHICGILECSEVVDLAHSKLFKKEKRLKRIPWKEYTPIHLWRNVYFIDFHIAIYNKEADTYFILNNSKLLIYISVIFFIVMPIIMILFLYPLIKSIKIEKEYAILNHVSNEALLANKSMIMITENIHHELNTPLEIIDNKIEKIHNVFNDYIVSEYENCQNIEDNDLVIYNIEKRQKINKRLVKLKPDFEFIKTSSEQIYNILEKMKGFKHMRYSNGNKTLTDIFESAFKIISISNSNYEYIIDEQLSNYSISSKTFRNADLLGIIINNIKNSLEASTSKFYIMINGYKKGFLKVRIIDNGSGIKKELIKKIFEPNFSTKSQDRSIRGNGMYLNKQILNQAGGDTYVVSSSSKGTTLELVIPVKERD